MKKILKLFLVPLVILAMVSCMGTTKYETVPGDPLNVRIYTLDNGLKVYLSVNPEKPRIQADIAVRVGGKNDPAETTGLAHYFEHLMFKGTKIFGTQNYEMEEPMLNEIESLFEVYRKTTDEAERKAIYKKIDSISYEASKLAIPNEYDKLMSSIGATNTNAFTGMDMTVYVEDIPSNEVENWAKIQSDRFQNAVIRGFHTELETVYEEKNMSLTSDRGRVSEKIMSELYKNHPYGTQTVLGTQEHLKNPSITNIKNYYKEWYVPNNMAISMSGDFNPDEVIEIIKKYFGSIKPNNNLKQLSFKPETPITQPIETEVVGIEAENVTIAWRAPGAKDDELTLASLAGEVLYNGKAGIIDLNVNQQQKLLFGVAYLYTQADYSSFRMNARPKKGQSLEEVKNILLEQVDKLRKGEFDESLLTATVNNFKRHQQQQMESNEDRAFLCVNSFINGTDWKDEVTSMDKWSKITKAEVVDFANRYLKDNNYIVVYKREGKPNDAKMSKPSITPIFMNRDTSSAFLREIQSATAKPIEPVFLDYSKDMNKLTAKSNIPVLYKENTTNDLFSLMYVFDMGRNDDKVLETAVKYFEYLGTSKMTPEQIKQEFYKLACDYFVSSGLERTYVGLTGLSENMPQALALFESLLADVKGDERVLENMKADILKSRVDNKKSQNANYGRLMQYAYYGAKSPALNIMSEKEIKALKSNDLLNVIKTLTTFEHTILYYGSQSQEELLKNINALHNVPEKLTPVNSRKDVVMQLTPTNRVFIAPYDAKQIYMAAFSNRGEKFNPANTSISTLYNAYFAGGMNAIVFQEMREARGLAYSADARLRQPIKLDKPYYYSTFIATQNDKMIDALKAFDEIINNMPESQNAFDLAKESLITNLRTERITKVDVLWSYMAAQDLGLKTDRRKELFEDLQKLTLSDVKKFQQEWVKGRSYTYCILGNEKDLDLKNLTGYGPITRLTTKDIFGY
ncbi:insulinase family protein [Odoribacter sp. OttesenSCG-928-G04]|nr:insulinase family protein [Odoribacter sp. OttesenSCG-928-G04]